MLEIAASHDALLKIPGAEQTLREEATEPGQPHDLRVPPAEDVVGAVVHRGSSSMRARASSRMTAARRMRSFFPIVSDGTADGGRQRKMPFGPRGVGRHRAARQRLGAGVQRVALGRSSRCRESFLPRPSGRWHPASWPRSSAESRASAASKCARPVARSCAWTAAIPILTWSWTSCARRGTGGRQQQSDGEGEEPVWALTGSWSRDAEW